MGDFNTYHFPFAKYPAVRIALLFITGIICSNYISASAYAWGLAFVLLAFIWLWAEYQFRSSLVTGYTSLSIAAYLAGVICFGALWHSLFDHQKTPASAQLLSAYTWEQVEINGEVNNIKQTSTGKYQLDITTDSTIFEDSLHWGESYVVRAVYDPAEKRLPAAIQLGAIVHFKATVYPLESKSNPHEFDYKQYLSTLGIYSQVGIDKIVSIKKAQNTLSWNTFRRHTLRLIEHNFSSKTVSIAKALLMGHKNEMQREDKIAFSRAGLSHIMAVSGLHVGFIIAPFWLLIPFCWAFRWGKYLGLSALVFGLIFYAGLTNFSASVVRASLTGGLLAYGRLFHKSRDSKNITAVAAIIILLFNPNDLFDIGFQLSFGAVYIILLILPVVQRFIPAHIQRRWYGIPIMVVIVSFIVQIGLYPLLSFYFGEFSLVGPLANAVIVPWLSVVVPLGLLLLAVSAVFPEAGMLLNYPNDKFLEFLQWFVNEAVSWNWSWIQTPSTGLFIFMIWGAVLFLVASVTLPRLRWKMLILFLIVLSTQQVHSLYTSFQPAKLQITMLDVGQGDAAFIQTPAGKNFLVDAGRWMPTYNSARYVIIPHLKARGVQKLDGVFLSHPHADHIGGIIELLNNMPIDTVYNSGFKYESQLYKNYLALANQKNVSVKPLRAGMQIQIDPAVRLFVYGPSAKNHHTDPNEQSLVMELIYGETEFLFTGDAGADQERLLLHNFAELLDADFLKVGHHGSRTSSSIPFLSTVTPDIAAVSLGLRNRYQHPHTEAVDRLMTASPQLYYTSQSGALHFSSNGYNISRHRWR